MDETRDIASLKRDIWRRFWLLVPLLLVLVIASYLYVKSKAGFYTTQTMLSYSVEELRAAEVTLSDPSVVEVASLQVEHAGSDFALVRFRALADGQCTARFVAGEQSETWTFEVRNGTIIEGGVNFEGWQAIQLSLCVFLGALVLLFADGLVRLWRVSWYGYTMVGCGGGFLFCLFQFLFYSAIWLVGGNPNLYSFLTDVTYAVVSFAAFSFYVMVPLALFVSISNIALIRHEGLRPVNVLGIGASLVWIVVFGHWVLSYGMQQGIWYYAYALAPVAISYGECLLLSTMLCAWLSSRHVPKRGADYLVILGCGIRADGTPCPLLAGRVDRAFAFDEARRSAGDVPAVFVPSGGQGSDEPVSEAQSMGAYLETQRGVAHERIVLEDRSTTTRENMAFSREVIERHAQRDASELHVVFSTTNYHVFRGYVCAHQAGMAVEGLGAKTKYYFWPNAFLREFVGLLAARWPMILQTFAAVSSLYLLIAYLLTKVAI